jgi:hypothetical protein
MRGTNPEYIVAKSLIRRPVLSANVLEARRKSMQHLREWGWSDKSDIQRERVVLTRPPQPRSARRSRRATGRNTMTANEARGVMVLQSIIGLREGARVRARTGLGGALAHCLAWERVGTGVLHEGEESSNEPATKLRNDITLV